MLNRYIPLFINRHKFCCVIGYPPPSAFNWTGLYAGAHIGYGWNTADRNTYILTTGAFQLASTFKSEGVFGGVQLGYNQQYGNIVVGLEG